MNLKWLTRRKKLDRATAPEFWQHYLQHFDGKWYNKKQLIKETRFVVFDTETTGLDVKKDQIISIGAVSVLGNQIELAQHFECLIQQKVTGDKDSIVVHGLLSQDVKKGMVEELAVQEFVKYIDNAILVGHHIGFDVAMLNKSIYQLVPDKLKNKVLDTARLAIRFEHFSRSYQTIPARYSLDQLCERYQIRMSDRHTAAGDALITALLFLKLLARLEKRGVKTLGDLLTK